MAYTMFISGVSNSSSPDKTGKLNNVSADEIVMVFDSIENYRISHQNEKTGYAIETRSNITDHVFSPDSIFSFTGRVTSSPMHVRPNVEWDKGVDKNNPKASQRIKTAYETLKEARDSRSGISISCEEFDITNYVITNLELVKDGPVELGIFNVTLTEQRFAKIGTTVLATGVGAGSKSKVEGSSTNVAKGSTQDANGNKPPKEVVQTLNMNSKMEETFKKYYDSGRKDFGQVIPESQKTEKFKLGLEGS